MAETEYQCSNCRRDLSPNLKFCPVCAGVDEVGTPVPKLAPPPALSPVLSNVIPLNRGREEVIAPVGADPVVAADDQVEAQPEEIAKPRPTPLDADVVDFLRDMETCRAGDMNIITLLGFPTAGKTFFLNRFKYQILQEDSPYLCTPGHEQIGTFINSTTSPSVHVFEGDEDYEKFAIVDIPGEYFREYLEQGRGAGGLRAEVKAAITDVLEKSKGLVVLLPAEEVAFSGYLYSDFVMAGGLLPWLADHYGETVEALGLAGMDLPAETLDYLADFSTEAIVGGANRANIAEENFYDRLAGYLDKAVLDEDDDFDLDKLNAASVEARRTFGFVLRRLNGHCRAYRELHTFVSNIVQLPYRKSKSPPIYVALSKADCLETRVTESRATTPEAGAAPEPAATPKTRKAVDAAWRKTARRVELALMLRSQGVSEMALERIKLEDSTDWPRMATTPDEMMEKDQLVMKPLASKFSSRKYGFVTAFAGLDKAQINYKLPQDGVYSVIEWIFDSLDMHSRYSRDSKLYKFILRIKGKTGGKPISPPRKQKS